MVAPSTSADNACSGEAEPSNCCGRTGHREHRGGIHLGNVPSREAGCAWLGERLGWRHWCRRGQGHKTVVRWTTQGRHRCYRQWFVSGGRYGWFDGRQRCHDDRRCGFRFRLDGALWLSDGFGRGYYLNGKAQPQVWPDQIWRAERGPVFAYTRADIQLEQVVVTTRIAEQTGGNTAQRVAALHDVPLRSVALLDNRAWQGEGQRPTRIDQACAVEHATVRHLLPVVGVDDPVEFLYRAVVPLGNGPARSKRLL